jgi:hypothetical protein
VSRYYDKSLDFGLVGEWRFDEVTGLVVPDSSGYAQNFAVSGADWAATDKGLALTFNGSSDYCNIVDPPSVLRPNNITVEVYFRPDTSTSDDYACVIGQPYDDDPWGSPYFSWNISRSGSSSNLGYRVTTGVSNTYLVEPSTGGFTNGQWTHAVLTYDGATMYCYEAGAQVGTDGTMSGSLDYDADYPDITLGVHSVAQAGEYFGGEIALARIYDRVLAASEVSARYQQVLQRGQPDRRMWLFPYPIRPVAEEAPLEPFSGLIQAETTTPDTVDLDVGTAIPVLMRYYRNRRTN